MDLEVIDVLHESEGKVFKHLSITIYASDLKTDVVKQLMNPIATDEVQMRFLKQIAFNPLAEVSFELYEKKY